MKKVHKKGRVPTFTGEMGKWAENNMRHDRRRRRLLKQSARKKP